MVKKEKNKKTIKKSGKVVRLETNEQVPLADFAERAYLDYSMYVILDRALPALADGLKPVQRRIIFAMSELGLSNQAKYKKSARTIGDVIGKFHPHGDGACYEAMVHMSQPFSYRYPLVDGQGNWGSQDAPKSFAAMRYTEAKLTKYAQILLSEIGKGTVDYQLNFDATLSEPKLLPARLPNILLNGATGIAVGMSTDIPPHNCGEVVDALLHLIDNPKSTVKDIMQFIKGPDFSTAAEIITSKQEIKNIYENGLGMVKARAVYLQEGSDIIINELPHQVSGSKILEQIAAQMRQKKLPMLVDLRDESDHENPTRLVITLKSNKVDKDEVMGHLFASTDLERNYRVNLNAIDLNGKPKVFNLVDLLSQWLIYRTQTVTGRLNFRLDKVNARLNILEGYLIAYLNIDAVIKVIRESDSPKDDLMRKFKLNEKQAEAILEIKLRQLAKLEEIKIKAEQSELKKEKSDIEIILASKQRLKTLIKKELKEDQANFGDKRRTKFVKRSDAKVIEFKEKIPDIPITVILSKKGWVRQAKGQDLDTSTLNFKAGDSLLATGVIPQNENIIFVDSTGRTYTQSAYILPSARGYGEPLTVRLSPPPGASFIDLITSKPEDNLIFLTSLGYGFCTSVADLISKNKKGKAVINISEGASLLPSVSITKETHIAILTNEGRLLIVPLKDVPVLAKGKGNKLMQISVTRFKAGEEYILAVKALTIKSTIEIKAGKRKVTLSGKELEYYLGKRAERGHKLPKGFTKVSDIKIIPKY